MVNFPAGRMTMKMILLGAVALAATVPAIAQMQPATPAPRAMPTMPAMGPMAEKSQTRDQVVAKVREHIAKMDANRDGFVGTDEMQAMRGQHKQKMGAMGGRRGDRMAQGAGVGRDPAAMFDRIDANRDGMISRDEFAKGHQMRIERKMVMKGTPGAPGMDGEHGGMMKMHDMGGKMGGGMMKMTDLNKDGRVSLQEATTSALQHFDMADTNRDGRITPDERRSMYQKMMQMRAPKAG